MAAQRGGLLGLVRHVRESLLLKLLISVIAVITLAVFIYGIVYLSDSEKRVVRSAMDDANRELDSVLVQVGKNQYILMVAMRLVTTDDELLRIVDDFENHSAYELYAYKFGGMRALVTLSEINSALRIFRMYLPQSKHVELWPVIYAKSRLEAALPAELLQPGSDFWQIGHHDYAAASDNRSYISYFQWVKGTGGAVAEVGMSMDDFFGEYYRAAGDNTIAVIGGGGALVCSSGAAHAGLLAERGAELADLLRQSGQQSGSIELDGAQGDVLLYRYSDLLQQYICNIVSRANIWAFIGAERANVIRMMVLVLIILLTVISLIIFTFLKRLTVLKDYMLQVQNEGMAVRALVLGNDEVGQLAQVFNSTVEAMRALYHVFIEDEETLRRSELRQLQHQINWHFAYNTLGTVEMHAVVNENYQIADAISAFGKLLRYAVEADDRLVTLEEEITYLQNYVLLINMQYDDEITLGISVPDELMSVRMPRLLLQPLVENAFQHGFQEAGRGGNVEISARESDGGVVVCVSDDGIGIAADKLLEIMRGIEAADRKTDLAGEHIALANIQQRLWAHFGYSHYLQLDSDGHSFTRASVRLPLNPEQAMIARGG